MSVLNMLSLSALGSRGDSELAAGIQARRPRKRFEADPADMRVIGVQMATDTTGWEELTRAGA